MAEPGASGLGGSIPLRDVVPSPRYAARVWRRNARVFSKVWKGALLPNFFDPLFYLVALGFGLGTYIATIEGIPYEDFIAPGLIASAAMWAASFECTYNVYLKMHESKLYDAVLATPVEIADLAAGDIFWGATRATIYGTTFLIIVAIFGLLESAWAVFIPLFVFLGGLAFSVLGYTFTALIPKIDLYSYYFTLVITPMFLFSGIFFPFDRLPPIAEIVAWFTPLFHLVEITRGLATGPVALEILLHTAWLFLFSTLLFYVPVRALRTRLLA
ncbi:MAG: ABC transporter permease [Solirubrobacterales bacterium]